MKPQQIHLIVAEAYRQADLTARIDNGWERIGGGRWMMPAGDQVRYASDPHHIIGQPLTVKVFLGHDWFKRRECEALVHVARMRGNRVIDFVPLGPQSLSVEKFQHIVQALGSLGKKDIEWAENIEPPPNADDFARETIYVICNSGMRFTVARGIYDRVEQALADGKSASAVFGHKGKAAAIDAIWKDRDRLYVEYMGAADKLAHLAALPWIGNITKYHLAKNFGLDVAKPDVHLERLARVHETTTQDLCEVLAAKTGYRIATVDTLLWRACATGVMNSHTGALAA